jgi:hypothetical protein
MEVYGRGVEHVMILGYENFLAASTYLLVYMILFVWKAHVKTDTGVFPGSQDWIGWNWVSVVGLAIPALG